MDNNLPSENYRPEDEYPALGAQPIAAAEPVIEQAVRAEENASEEPVVKPFAAEKPNKPAATAERPAAPVTGAPATGAPATGVPATGVPATVPAVSNTAQPAPPVQQAYLQNTIPYMTYPIYPMMPGMMQYPQQNQQQYPQQGVQGPFVYPNYTGYFMPYPQQQTSMQQPVQQPVQQPPVQQQPIQQTPPDAPRAAAPPVQPYAQYRVPDTKDVVPQNKKTPTSTGTKAFLIILSALLLAMVAGFIVYIINASGKDAAKDQGPEQLIPQFDDKNIEDLPEDFGIIDNDASELKHTELEEEIKLVADDGATQKRDTDNPESVGTPDKNAKGIELKELPKDADKSEHTAKTSFNALVDSVVTISCYKDKITENIYDIVSSGSGAIISADGYIVTNAHVLNNSKTFLVNVTLNNGKKYQAKIIGYDTWTDLAVIKIDAKDLKPVVFGDSDLVEVGDDVIAIGSPGGAKYQNSLTQGVISAVDREISVSKFVRYIQSDAAINPGSSGGPLCNLYGQVIGITTAKTTAQNFESMSFSIPSATVKDVLSDLIHYGYIPDRSRIGFAGTEVSSEEKMYYGLPAGVIVTEISDDGALKDTKVKEGDIITAIDGEKVGSFQDIYNILSKHKAGDKIKLSIYRVEEEGFFEEEPTINAK